MITSNKELEIIKKFIGKIKKEDIIKIMHKYELYDLNVEEIYNALTSLYVEIYEIIKQEL